MSKISLFRCGITDIRCDCIVNAADRHLSDNGIVSKAIFQKAGPQLYEECKKIGGCEVGNVVVTPSFKMHGRYIIHAVGPHYYDGTRNERELLYSCYYRTLELVRELSSHDVVFPVLSTGGHGYPVEEAFVVACSAFNDFIKNNGDWDINIFLVSPDRKTFEIGRTIMEPFIPTDFSQEEIQILKKIDEKELQECIAYFATHRIVELGGGEQCGVTNEGKPIYHVRYPKYDLIAFEYVRFLVPTLSDVSLSDDVWEDIYHGVRSIFELNILELGALLKSYSTRERFCEGTLAGDMRDGTVLRIFVRIEELLYKYKWQIGRYIKGFGADK